MGVVQRRARELILGTPALGHVERRADHPERGAVPSHAQAAPVREPALLTARPNDPHVALERALGHAGLDELPRDRPIGGMHEVEVAVERRHEIVPDAEHPALLR
jgi:hypothetical protein